MIAPALQTEGKALQTAQQVGMGAKSASVAAHAPNGTNGHAAEKALQEA
jgi:IMP dehydrogenase